MSLGNDKNRIKPVSEKVEEPDHALKSYLDTLLLEIETIPSESVVVKEPPPVADIKVEESQISEPKLEQSTQTQQQQDSALPEWVENEFQVLLFKV
ncbi:MAG: hypothetical protein AB2729_05135, partial [Candidatus Thiodiazotropha taylori]|nr:hypothetical protein [Candidatus Thiodiazotropha taylori]MCW4315705.1 hypothetical protein [Candidatus Thiodiazotropha taylori]